jgi:hypothetical protein
VAQVDRGAEALHLRFAPQTSLSPEALVRTVRSIAGATVSAQGVLRVPLRASTPLDDLRAVLATLENAIPAVAGASAL